jgi:tetratricopeptide (TPR) repeat protein
VTQGRLDEATQAAELVIDLARQAGDARIAARSAGVIAYLMLHGSTPVEEGMARCRELQQQVTSDRAALAAIQSAEAILLAMHGRFEEARSLYQRGYEVLVELGAGIIALTSSIDSSQVERLAGDLATAEQELRRDYDALTEIDESYYRSTVAAFLSQVLLAAGRADEALHFTEVAESLGEADDVLTQVPWRGVRAKILAAQGDAEAGRRLAAEAVELAAATPDIHLRADALVDLADVLEAIGDPESAGPPLREALQLLEQKGDRVSAGRIRERIGVVPA